MKPAVGALVSAVMLAGVAGCGDDDDSSAAGSEPRLSVVASFYPVAAAAEAVGGDLVEVTNLTPAGAEPHDLELSPRQVDALEDADLVLYLGDGFQPAVQDIAGRRDGPSVDLLDGLALEPGAAEADEHGHGEGADDDAEEGEDHAGEEDEHAEEEAGDDDQALDPHFWLDPTLLAEAAERIEQALADVDPDSAGAFAANAEAYRAELEELDGEFETGLGDCQRRVIVTSHAAFHYLAERYGLEQLPIAGLSPESEPTPQRLAELADLIAREGVTTVFYETLVAPAVAETLAREAGVDTAVLNPIEGLAADDVEAGRDYLAVMRENLDALRQALDCA